jgi:UDP-glucose 4-epimerase
MMILVTGGLGFVGLNTARALLELGESCLLTRYRVSREPDFLSAELGRRVFVEQVDIADRQAVLDLGRRYEITGIVHLAESGVGVPSLTEDVRLSADPLMNMLRAAHEWGVPRISIASAIGVYVDAGKSPLSEDLPLTMTATYPFEVMKKSAELIAGYVAAHAGFEVVIHRISGVYGPLCHNLGSPLAVAARLVHAAVRGREPEFTERFRPYAEDGIDWIYAKDCGRAIAMLQTASTLHHRVYNIGAGHATRNKEFVTAIRKILPDAQIQLPAGHDPAGLGEDVYLDTSRLRADTGFEPAYDVEHGIADYIAWLNAGNTI